MENEREKWDASAGDYQRVFSLGLNEYNASLLRFWHEEGMLFPGARVLDIGCGVGKYGTYLAELGYDVTLTDISGEMLRHASANMAKYHTPWAVYRCDFNEASGEEPAFSEGFDLTISTMSPAIHDAETVRKMGAMTRGWCFLARFRDWEQPFRDALMREMGMEPRRGDLRICRETSPRWSNLSARRDTCRKLELWTTTGRTGGRRNRWRIIFAATILRRTPIPKACARKHSASPKACRMETAWSRMR